MLADEQLGEKQVEILRAMSGERRLQLAEQLYWSARKMKTAGARAQHPDWPEVKVAGEVRRYFLHGRS